MDEVKNKILDKPVSLKQLAEELGFHSSGIRRVVERCGFTPIQLLEGANKPFFLTFLDAELFRQRITDERANKIIPRKESHSVQISGVYFIEVPSYEGKNRVKIGWSDKLSERFSTYRTIIPDLRVMAIWPTTDSWSERAALKCAERLGRRVHQELFEFEDNSLALSELIELFLKLGIDAKLLAV